MTLQEIADVYGLTRERIRQIIERTYEKLDNVNEDQYKDIYEKYELSELQFTTIFNAPKSTYYYLFDKYTKGNLDFTELESQYYTNEDMLKRIKSLKNEICIDNIYVNGDRNSVTKYYLKYRCKDEIIVSNLYELLNDFISNGLGKYEIDLYESVRNLESYLSRQNWCVFGNKKKVRYYERDLLSENDILKLSDSLDVEYGFYSSLYFYENNLDLMEELDIRNEHELHNIYKNMIAKENVTYLRMPNILIGYQDKKDFILDKMTELSPIMQTDFLQIMRSNYGHREDTMLAYLTSEFSEYNSSGMIISQVVDISMDLLKELILRFNKTIYSLNEFKDILRELPIDNYNQLLNNINLKKINYKIVGSYVIKDIFSTLEEAFYIAIVKGELTHSFIGTNSTSYGIINKLESEKKIIEIDNKYYPFECIYRLGNTKEDIENLLSDIKLCFSRENYYFTVKTVRKEINNKVLTENNISDSILKSLIKSLDNFKRILWHGNIIFCYSPNGFISRMSFLKNVIDNHSNISLKELQQKLEDEYGVIVNIGQIKVILYHIRF